VTYAVPPWLAFLLAAATAALVAAAATTPLPGRLLFLVAAAFAGVETARAALLRPTLRADENGVEVTHGWRREHVPWDAVENVTTLNGRGGRTSNALEIDLGERLIVVPGYRLGVPAADAAASLKSLMSSGDG
jgi:hypothetical protein